jgi:hypothetical protein
MPACHGWVGVVHGGHLSGLGVPEVFERIEYPICYQRECIVMLVQMESPARIGNDSLHDIVRRHHISQVVFVGA